MKLSDNITNTNPVVTDRYAQYYRSGLAKGFGINEAQQYATTNLYNLVQVQALTVSLKIILGWLIIIGIGILILVLIYPFNNHKKLKFIRWRKDMG